MAKWEQLIGAREKKHFSQLEMAELLKVGPITYQRWETGRSKPQPQHMRRLYEVFGTTLDTSKEEATQDAITPKRDLESSPHASIMRKTSDAMLTSPSEEIDVDQIFITTNMTTHLWSLAFMNHPSCNDKRASLRHAIKEFDAMNADNKNYQITRREALYSLATLPMITLGLNISGKTIQPAQYSPVLAHCAASLEACSSLCHSSNESDLALPFQCVSKYVSLLNFITTHSSQHRKEAAQLATQYAILKTILGWHCKGTAQVIQYAHEAVVYSKVSDDPSLQLSAYSKLAWAYMYDKKYRLALETAQEAQFLLEHTPTPLPACILGGTYSTLALMQARNRIEPDIALGKIIDMDPGNEVHAFMEFTRTDLPREVGQIHYYHGDQAQALEWLEKTVDPPQGKRGRIDTYNSMALSTLKAKNRDMEKAIHLWTIAAREARELRSEWGYDEVSTTYELMEAVWPNEARVSDLRDYLIHWE